MVNWLKKSGSLNNPSLFAVIVRDECMRTAKDRRRLLNIYCRINTWTCLFLFLFYITLHTNL